MSRTSPLSIYLGITLALAVVYPCFAAEFELDGMMTITPKRYGISEYHREMKVNYRDCQWKITSFAIWKTNKLVEELSDDGRNIYKVTHIEENAITLTGRTTTLPNSWSAKLYSPGYPSRTFNSEIEILFNAYASSCYLESMTNAYSFPIKFQPDDMELGDARVKVLIVRNAGVLGLPIEEIFMDSTGMYTNAILRSMNFTNIAGMEIPQRTILTRFASDDGRPLVEYEFTVLQARSKCSNKTFALEYPSNTVVADHRFARGKAYVPPIMHVGSTGGWPSEVATKEKPGYKITKMDWEKIMHENQQAVGKLQSSKRSLFIRVTILAFFAVAGVLVILGFKVSLK